MMIAYEFSGLKRDVIGLMIIENILKAFANCKDVIKGSKEEGGK
jgi:hypothetical protein